jgi:CheY-like chemotaxis protein/two-component sensor histidine kinase
LLDVSRITRGKIRLEMETVDLHRVISRAVETSRPLIDAGRHELVIRLPSGPLRVRGDVTRLSQVVSNLLNNAAKFTAQEGQISLSVVRRDGEACIAVRDSGVGIPPEQLSTIFDLFAQGDSTLERSHGGLGIGLTLVRSLTEMHGGAVEVHSEGVGRGAEFIVRLPALPVAGPPGQVDQELSTSHAQERPQRIVVVDDNVDAAETLVELLRHRGHDARMATDGGRALEEATSFLPQVMFIDIGLPGKSGLVIARELRLIPQLKETTLIALTGYGRDEDRRMSRQAGFDQHWVKPVDPDLLTDLLASLS